MRACLDHGYTAFTQKTGKFCSNSKIDIFLVNAVNTYSTAVFSTVARILLEVAIYYDYIKSAKAVAKQLQA